MTGPRTAVAVFVEGGTTFPLAVTKSGRGAVVSAPPGIRCGSTCSGSFLAGTLIRLRAVAAKRARLVSWTGACKGSKSVCLVGMDGPKSASATFAGNADQAAPRVAALPSSGKRGEVARLRYRVTDNSGKSREWATVYRGRKRLARVRGPLDQADRGVLFYFLRWRVPATLAPGKLRFCVTAQDQTGNRSKPSCAPLRVG
jgi:hypothetical protein